MYSSISILLLVGVIKATHVKSQQNVFQFPKKAYNFGEIIKVSFTNVDHPSAPNNFPYIAIFKHRKQDSMNEIPPWRFMNLWLNDCNTQEDCDYEPEDGPETGNLSFGVSPSSDCLDEDKYFPLNPAKKYKICMLNEVWEEDGDDPVSTNLIGQCQTFKVKPYKKNMLAGANVRPKKFVYNQNEAIQALVKTKVKVVNMWVGLFKADETPVGELPCDTTALWAYYACENQVGDQPVYETCSKTPAKKMLITLDETHVAGECMDQWPLETGFYYMCLVFNSNEPLSKYKCSKKRIKINEA